MLDNLQTWFADVETVLLTLLVVIAVWVIIKALATGNRSWTRALILIPIAVLVVWGASNIQDLTGPIQDEFNDVFGAAAPASVVLSGSASTPTDPGIDPAFDLAAFRGAAPASEVALVMGGVSTWMT